MIYIWDIFEPEHLQSDHIGYFFFMIMTSCLHIEAGDKIMTLYLCVYYPVAEGVPGSLDLDSGRDSLLICQISLKEKKRKKRQNISEHLYSFSQIDLHFSPLLYCCMLQRLSWQITKCVKASTYHYVGTAVLMWKLLCRRKTKKYIINTS